MAFVGILVTLMVPFFLILTAARIVFNPFYLDYEYNLASFPQDPYGFTTQDRLKWGKLSLTWLFNQAGPEFLANEKLPDGSPLYNEREMSHMMDVKSVIQIAETVWISIIVLLALSLVLTWRTQWRQSIWRSASRGGILTIALILLVLLGVAVNFDQFFAIFHGLFFASGSWLFYESDTLIRLFPLKLWSDGFTFTGILTLTGAILLVFLGRGIAKKES
jgi:integral membrane protein (TIGR01906 family)